MVPERGDMHMIGKILRGPSTRIGWIEMQLYQKHRKTTGDRPDVRLASCNFDRVAREKLFGGPPDALNEAGFQEKRSDNLRLETLRPVSGLAEGPEDGPDHGGGGRAA